MEMVKGTPSPLTLEGVIVKTVGVKVTVGMPVIAPVARANCTPLGRDAEIAKDEGAYTLTHPAGVIGTIFAFMINEAEGVGYAQLLISPVTTTVNVNVLPGPASVAGVTV